MKRISELGGWALYNCITHVKALMIALVLFMFTGCLVGCGGTKKASSKAEEFQQEVLSDSQYSHAKDYIDTTVTEIKENGSKTVTEYFKPTITKDSAGNTVITADKIITSEEKHEKQTKEKKGISRKELTTITKTLHIRTQTKLIITKTVTHKGKWWMWMLIGAVLFYTITKFAPRIISLGRKIVFPGAPL